MKMSPSHPPSPALTVLTEAAEKGKYSRAQYYLALCYDCGQGVNVDENKAAEFYSLAASQDLSYAQYSLGLMHLYGKGVLKDRTLSEEWLSMADAGGCIDARNILKHLRGNGRLHRKKWKKKHVLHASKNKKINLFLSICFCKLYWKCSEITFCVAFFFVIQISLIPLYFLNRIEKTNRFLLHLIPHFAVRSQIGLLA